MAGLVNPGGRPAVAKASAAHVELLKDTVRSALVLEAGEAVLIQQLACAEPDCPPVETVVAVLGALRRSWRFASALTDIAPAQLRATLTDNPEGHDHDDHG